MPDDPRPADDARPDAPRPDTPRPVGAEPAGDAPAGGPRPGADAAHEVPDEAELARTAVPGTVRRAPRYRAFVVTGALLGALVGLVLAVVTAEGSGVADDGGVLPFLGGQNGIRALMALSGVLVGGLVGGAWAVVADRRSTRRARPAPRD